MLTRRAVLIALSSAPAWAEGGRTAFVLVPGAWHGAWCWDGVVARLKKLGLAAAGLTLTGVADRAAEGSPQTGLADHVADVVRAIDASEGAKVVLVGHSYGGLPITGAAAQRASKLAHLVYLDAFVPAPGEAMLQLMKPAYSASWRRRAAAGDGWHVPPMLGAKAMGVEDAALAAQVDRQLTPQPLRTFTDPLVYDAQALAPIPKLYVRCARYPGFGPTAARVAKAGWAVRTIDAGHDAMLAAPDALAAILAPLASEG